MVSACGMHTIGLLAPAFLSGSLYTSFQAYWTTLEEKRTSGNTSVVSSVSFGVFYAFALLSVLTADCIMRWIGRKMAIALGTLLMVIASGLFIALSYVDTGLFYAVTIVGRSLLGFGCGLSQTTTFAVIGVAYKDSLSLVMAFYELTMGMGFALGPFIGSGLYWLGEFTLVMAFYGSLGALFLFIVLTFVPKHEFDRSGVEDIDPLTIFEYRLDYMNKEKERLLKVHSSINSAELFNTVANLQPEELIRGLSINSYC